MQYIINVIIFLILVWFCTKSDNEKINFIAFGVTWTSGAIYFFNIIDWQLLIILCTITFVYNFIIGYSMED